MPLDPLERKLAAILSADVVGYSRMMAEDETATIHTLSDYREAIALLVRQHRGRVVDAPGDNVLADFRSALEAVRCAIELQAVLRARNASLPDERRMQFRIGVHMGDVAVEGERVYGDGVNIAARLEGLADAGGICISATVHEQVRNKLDVSFVDLGDQDVKNIPERVRVYRVQPEGAPTQATAKAPSSPRSPLRTAALAAVAFVVLAVGALWASWPAPLGWLVDLAGIGAAPVNPALPENPSIAVLPFTNMSGDPEQEYFSDGLSEDITTALSSSPRLFVIARNSAFTYKGEAVSVERVGRELGVRYVLEGSVRRAGDRVRVTAQLIDATTDAHVWSQRYDRDLSDIFEIQSEITAEIRAAVGVEIRAAEAQRLANRPTQSLTVADAMWRGSHLLAKGSKASTEEARRLVEHALELEPDDSAAHALLAGTYIAERTNGWDSDPEVLERAELLSKRAIELDPGVVIGYTNLAFAAYAKNDAARAITYADRAIELAPSEPFAHACRGLALASGGRLLEATQSIRYALHLSPKPSSMLWSILAYVNWGAGREAESIEAMERAIAQSPDNIVTRLGLLAAYARKGREEEARQLGKEIMRVRPDFTIQEAMVFVENIRPIVDPEYFAKYPQRFREAGIPDAAAAGG